jgi:pyridoxamine 5'-phosphate oxidase
MVRSLRSVGRSADDRSSAPALVLRELPVVATTPPPCDTDRAPDDPVALFIEWQDGAIEEGVAEPHAMTLSTIDADGAPGARVLILKDVDDRGWWFATSSTSRKGYQLEHRSAAALLYESGR